MYALGIDVGTTYTAAAVWRDGRAEICALGTHSASVPSVVLVRADGTVLTGEAAARRALVEPDRVAREFKRRLGDVTPIVLGGSPFSAETLTARLLSAIVAAVVDREGGTPSRICVSHPANWGPYKLDLLRQAVTMAGLGAVVSFTTEPEAAAVSYARTERLTPGEIVAVYDLGGGTFDAAVLRRTGTGFEILGQPEGIERLGGIDIDAAVYAHVARAVGERLAGLDEDDPAAVAAVARLRAECTSAKEALSTDTDTAIPVLLPGYTGEVRLTRAELEAMVRPPLYDSIEALRRALRSAGVAGDELSAVLLVGGSSRIPLVAQLVGAELGRPVAVDTHPKHAVALGAAWIAGGVTLPGTTPSSGLPSTGTPVPGAAAAPAARPPASSPVPSQAPASPVSPVPPVGPVAPPPVAPPPVAPVAPSAGGPGASPHSGVQILRPAGAPGERPDRSTPQPPLPPYAEADARSYAQSLAQPYPQPYPQPEVGPSARPAARPGRARLRGLVPPSITVSQPVMIGVATAAAALLVVGGGYVALAGRPSGNLASASGVTGDGADPAPTGSPAPGGLVPVGAVGPVEDGNGNGLPDRVEPTPTTVPGRLVVTVRFGGGVGRVTSTDGRISCPGTCTAEFRGGSTVTLVAGGPSFLGWSACARADGTTCTIGGEGGRAPLARYRPPASGGATTPPATSSTRTSTTSRTTSTPPGLTSPPVTTPPVVTSPPVTTPPVVTSPPVTTPPAVTSPPVTTPPVTSPPAKETTPPSSTKPVEVTPTKAVVTADTVAAVSSAVSR